MSQEEISRKEADLPDDRTLLSPPEVVEPLYSCDTAIVLAGGASRRMGRRSSHRIRTSACRSA